MNKEEILEVLEEDVFHVVIDHKSAVNINNSGTLNESKLDREKKLVLHNAIDYLSDELIRTKQYYPMDDVADVDFKGDFVIIKRKDYNLFKLFIESL